MFYLFLIKILIYSIKLHKLFIIEKNTIELELKKRCLSVKYISKAHMSLWHLNILSWRFVKIKYNKNLKIATLHVITNSTRFVSFYATNYILLQSIANVWYPNENYKKIKICLVTYSILYYTIGTFLYLKPKKSTWLIYLNLKLAALTNYAFPLAQK